MEEDGCRETVIREIVEDKENEGSRGRGAASQGGREIENIWYV